MLNKIWIPLVLATLAWGAISWFGPQGISWYFDPPVEIGVNCRAAVEWAMTRLLYAQASGWMGGFILGAFVMYKLRKKPTSNHTKPTP